MDEAAKGTPSGDGHRSTQGAEERREPLSRERIVAAAIALVDREGLDALSMRRLGTELGGFEAMSLYRYFSSKAELVDAVVGGVWSEMSLPEDEPDPWERLRKLAWSWRTLAHAHPHVFPLLAARAVRSPSGLRPIEFAFRTFKEGGFGREEAGHAFLTQVGYVYGYALREIEGEGAPNFDVGGLPEGFGAIGELAYYFGHLDADRAFEWGLRVVVQGLRGELESSRASGDGVHRKRVAASVASEDGDDAEDAEHDGGEAGGEGAVGPGSAHDRQDGEQEPHQRVVERRRLGAERS